MPHLIHENVRVLEWGLYAPDGILFGAFRYEEDAQACKRQGMSVAPIDMKPIMSIDANNKTYPVDCYITLLAAPKEGESQ